MSESERPAKPRVEAAEVGDEVLSVLPLRDIVVFPHMIVPLFVGREKSVRALEAVMRDDKQILLVAQRNAAQDDPAADDIYRVGTVSTILQLLKLPDGTVKVLVEGGRRATIAEWKQTESHFEALVSPMPDIDAEAKELEALGRTVVGQFEQYIKLNKKIAPEVLAAAAPVAQAAVKTATKTAKAGAKTVKAAADSAKTGGAPAAIDPTQWWTALSQQFTQLATAAMKDSATDAARSLAGNLVKQSFDAASDTLKRAASVPGTVVGSVAKGFAAGAAANAASKSPVAKAAAPRAAKTAKPRISSARRKP